jgi:putative ABC transport system substrate-binding protein
MRRREFIAALLAGGAVSSPKAGHAQQHSLPVIGYLSTGQPTSILQEFLSSLAESGFLEGRNVVIEYRWAEGRYDRLPDLAAELVRRRVDVIVAVGGSMSGRAAKAATDTIPIVVLSGADPVEAGFAQTLSYPGGNVTGIAQLVVESDVKRLQLLHELMPSAGTIAYLENPNLTNAERNTQVLEAASRTLGVKLAVLRASSERDFDPAFATISQARVPALLLANDPFFFIERDRLVALGRATRCRRCIFSASSWLRGASSATAAILPTATVRSASTPPRFLRAPGRPICQSLSKRRSSW